MAAIDSLRNNLSQLLGWRTKRHIIVIESDDWGSIRMPSYEVRETLRQNGFLIDRCKFSSYDSLASEADLANLFDVLSSVKDANGRHAVLTANAVTANPDFKRIRESGFEGYYYEPFTETLKRYPPTHHRSFEMWKTGIDERIFIPQLHGREHLNIIRWMKALQADDEVTRLSFDQEHFGLSVLTTPKLRVRYMDAFCNVGSESSAIEATIVRDAVNMFVKMFGYAPKSFIAPCYIWRDTLEQTLSSYGISYIQGLPLQQIPVNDNPPKVKTRYHFLGQKNKYGQRYLIRNAFFEPYKDNTTDKWVDECLNRLHIAFRWLKPAIISSHRINFIGTIDERFRDINLLLFKKLLNEIVRCWPDVEFMSSDELGDLINAK